MNTREERMQQRLRGAQRRQIKDVDFGLIIPAADTPVEPVATSGHTPQADLRPQPSTRRTSASRVPHPDPSSFEENIRPVTSAHSANDANTSAKRRKLDTDLQPLSSARSTRSQRIAPRPDIYALEDDEQPESSTAETTNLSDEPAPEPVIELDMTTPIPTPETVRTPPLPPQELEETNESSVDSLGSGQRVNGSFIELDLAETRLQEVLEGSSADLTQVQTPIPPRKRKRGDVTPKSTIQVASHKPISQITSNYAADQDMDELSPEQPNRWSRKSRAAIQEGLSNMKNQDHLSDLPEQEEAEAIDDEQVIVLVNKYRARNVSLESSGLHEVEVPMHPGDVTSIPRLSSKIQKKNHRQMQYSSPVHQRHPKKANKKIRQPSKKTKTKSKLRDASPIPVTVYRQTIPPVYDEEEPDINILNFEIAHAKRSGVNSIDVLSQICQEMVGAGLDTLEEGGNTCEDLTLRREYKTKWRAVESFGKELQARLLEHAINLDNAYSLGRRVRDERKKKLGLREEICRIRAEREQVALRMDEIRIRHENETKFAQERDTLNCAVHDIELVVELGKNRDSDEVSDHNIAVGSIELLLKRVAGEVSNKGDSGGMLRQIKEFNAFLERTALVLESRKV